MYAKPQVYLLPGLLCDAAVWRVPAKRLAETHEVGIPVFHGYASLPAMANAVLVEAPDRFAVVGHSMGARVALEIIRRAPDRVERLALLNTGVHDVRAGEADKRHALVDLAFAQGMEALANEWAPPMVAPDRAGDLDLMEEITAMVCRATPEIFQRQIRALLNRPPAREVLAGVRCPAFVIAARQDAWSPVAQHEEIAAQITGAKLAIIEACGHMSPLERPEVVADVLMTWLSTKQG